MVSLHNLTEKPRKVQVLPHLLHVYGDCSEALWRNSRRTSRTSSPTALPTLGGRRNRRCSPSLLPFLPVPLVESTRRSHTRTNCDVRRAAEVTILRCLRLKSHTSATSHLNTVEFALRSAVREKQTSNCRRMAVVQLARAESKNNILSRLAGIEE